MTKIEQMNGHRADEQSPSSDNTASSRRGMYKKGISLTTAAVETDGRNRTKEMTETEQMNGHWANERSPSNDNTASRRCEVCCNHSRGSQEASSSIVPGLLRGTDVRKGRKAEEPERVQLELKETERRMKRRSREVEEETAQETRRQEGLKRGVTNGRPGHLLTRSKPT
ncbi:hypothetical protein M9H77_09628 [Catharanthus roseus]|uniref:Uncharacterized protein n=1 Tax=Catharanthus roseus TaxID=4058 RepID=A0ACC0C1L9_CATRO|nr:hypothetical protein M9H77_09628 [Catharanthus roseus]